VTPAVANGELLVDRDQALRLLRQLLRIRRFEERCVELYSATKIRGFLHLYIGEEAVAVGVMHGLVGARFLAALDRLLQNPEEL
jgi:TPP-dependent pyruvate/acetoin dehydrogenase alpha subunit